MNRARLVMNDKAIQDLLKSDRMQAGLTEIVDRIASAAGPGNEAGIDITPTRARGYVVTATPQAQESEARDRTLTRAIEAGR